MDKLILCDASKEELNAIKTSKVIKKIDNMFGYYGAPRNEVKDLEIFASNLEDNARYMKKYDNDYDESKKEEGPLIKKVLLGDGIKYVYCKIDSYNSNPCTIKVTRSDPATPISNIELLAIYTKAYQYMYEKEDEAVGNPGHIPGMLNRAKSSGPYGIWGHDIGDLVYNGLSQVLIFNDFIHCDFSVDS
ncbi:hypothetical protein ACTFIZ_010164 [Dictyostelium cf. discoideum]